MDFVLLFVSLGVILALAEIFTNGVEWLGLRLHLAEGAVGSILAAVGTALPESLIPLIAFVTGKSFQQHQVGMGAIFGAPFMLSTLAFFISGLVVIFRFCETVNVSLSGSQPGYHPEGLAVLFLWLQSRPLRHRQSGTVEACFCSGAVGRLSSLPVFDH